MLELRRRLDQPVAWEQKRRLIDIKRSFPEGKDMSTPCFGKDECMKRPVKRKVQSRRLRLNCTERRILKRLENDLKDCWTESFALLAHDQHFQAHRGAWEVADEEDYDEDQGIVEECIVFGNDGYATDVRARKEVAALVRRLESLGIEVLGFGLSPNRYSWAMRIAHNEGNLPEALVWDVWFCDVCGMKRSPLALQLKRALTEFKKVA